MVSIKKFKWLIYLLFAIILSLVFMAYHIITVEGVSRTPKYVMMRLEDIGPGGQYGSLEQLGKLRAVLENLHDQKAAYHLAVVPKWINLPTDGSVYDTQLDQSDNPYVAAFQKVLHQAVDDGATLGMHGYTHQVGNVRRDDGHHESGIGNEFNVPDVDETKTVSFAETRLREGLAILQHAGLRPQFWEAPHYRSTPEQDDMFRSYFGLNYQSDVQINRNAPLVQTLNHRNSGYGVSTLGAEYVPTPFDYIPFNKDEKLIIDRIGKSNIIASFYYHPFLEFKNLVPVTDENGEQVLRDGIPEYRYRDSNISLLQKLIVGLRAKGYAFCSIQDYVPFTPANSLKLQPGDQEKPMFEDANGDGQLDTILLDPKSGNVSVMNGRFRGLRNEAQGPFALWNNVDYVSGSAASISGKDDQGICSLWTVNPNGRLIRYVSDGRHFLYANSWKIDAHQWNSLYTLPQANGDMVIAGLTRDRTQLYGWLISKGEMKALKAFKFKSEIKNEPLIHREGVTGLFISKEGDSSGIEMKPDIGNLQWKLDKVELGLPDEDGYIEFGDYNGDGRPDALRWDPATMKYTVYLKGKDGEWELLSTFGPWGKSGDDNRLVIADFDGNGKSDLCLIDRTEGYIDWALSYESK